MSSKSRVIALVDMDCFYCQVEQKLNSSLQGKPIAVVQYNLWREGGIIAANYLAKEKGVNKGMWMHEAKALCPEIEFVKVAGYRGRADLTKYQEAGKQVVEVLSSFTDLVERASVDEAYLDLTEVVETELSKGLSSISLESLNTSHVVGCDISNFISNISCNQDTDGFCEDDLKLAVGGIFVEKIRAAVYEKTGYRCSAGIAHNKILAKLVCGIHKPNKQTIMPQNAVSNYFSELPLRKIKRLGGKFGKKVAEELNIQYVGELLKFSEKELCKKYDKKTGHWLYSVARGIDNEPVLPKLISKSINCCKRFPGKNALFKQKDVEHWINELGLEIAERINKDQEENNRTARIMTVSFTQDVQKNDVSNSKTCSLKSYDAKKISQNALEIIEKSCRKLDGSYHVKYLGICVGGFEDKRTTKDIKYFFGKNSRVLPSIDVNSAEIPDTLTAETSCIERTDNFSYNDTESMDNDMRNSIYDKNESFKYRNSQNSAPKQISTRLTVDIHRDNHEISSISEEVRVELPPDTFEEKYKDNLIPNIQEANSCHRLNALNGSTMDERSSSAQNSFFVRYFENFNLQNQANTSNTYEEMDLETSRISCKSEEIDTRDKSSEDHTKNELLFYETQFEQCEECNENVLITEFISHMDFHYASKLYNEYSDVNSPQFLSKKIIGNQTSIKYSKKRKAFEPSTSSIEPFLKKSKDSAITETCNECKREIMLDELDSHADYHEAKRLNRQLNFGNISWDDFSRRNKKYRILGNDISRYLVKKSD